MISHLISRFSWVVSLFVNSLTKSYCMSQSRETTWVLWSNKHQKAAAFTAQFWDIHLILWEVFSTTLQTYLSNSLKLCYYTISFTSDLSNFIILSCLISFCIMIKLQTTLDLSQRYQDKPHKKRFLSQKSSVLTNDDDVCYNASKSSKSV